MGPSVKFVSAIIDAFSNKKMGVNFFHRKKTKPGRGGGGPRARGVCQKTTHFSKKNFGNLPLWASLYLLLNLS